jgi:hypothetical protein
MKKFFAVITLLLLTASFAYAIPSLQLDIAGGTYDTNTQTIVSTTNPFTLYAYLIPDNNTNGPNALLTDTYYISAAITPQVGPVGQNLGSFTFNGVTINVTSDMIYGTPPVESDPNVTQLSDPGDLASHSIFPTYFVQFAFSFDANNKALAYDTQSTPGVGPTPDATGTMYYQAFAIDTSGLDPNYFVHFDLFNTLNNPITNRVCTGTGTSRSCVDVVVGNDVDINSFAPFSHDAESGKVPEPGTLLIFGSGILGLGFFGRKKLAK